MRRSAVILCLTVIACSGDETVGRYGAAGHVWALSELNGTPFPPGTTLSFPAPNRISGSTPCHDYSASMAAPYPWFEAGDIVASTRDCSDTDADQTFFKALKSATESEVLGDTLVLSGNQTKMIFKSVD